MLKARALFAVLVLLLSTIACTDPPVPGPATPTPVPPAQLVVPPRPDPVVRDLMLGERVEGVIGDGRTIRPAEHHFFMTVPKSGTLDLSLRWNPDELGTLLQLKVGDRVFPPSRPDWSPVVGRVPVEAGERYLIVVAVAGADWLPEDRFVLTSRLEP
jgi:hypothetical protein